MKKSKFFVISHTHWDREWYLTFEQFRTRLVDLIDRLLIILEENPSYIFHLDAQTIVLEDYLEIRPSKKNIISKYVKSGNIVTGPWYMQNDFYLTSGESTIRNLQIGIDMAREFGKTQLIGYAPDQFGHISQMPQIMNNFGITNYIFGRGFKHFVKDGEDIVLKKMPTEFILRGPDGSECLAIYMKEWYNNGQRFSKDIEKVKLQLDINHDRFIDFNVTPYILMMNGVDHLYAQEDVLEIIGQLKDEGYDVLQSSFEHYVSEVESYITENEIPLLVYDKPLNKGDDYSLLRGCWSSRILQKRMNVQAQDALENKLEPLLTSLENEGFKGVYDLDYMRHMWKLLLQNHPHDSICGCSKDAVHNHIEDRYKTLKEITDEQIKKAMEIASTHAHKTDDSNYTITVFNSLDCISNDIKKVKLEFLRKEKINNFDIFTIDNRKVDFLLIDKYEGVKDVLSPVNLPGVLDVDVFEIIIKTPVLEPYTFDQYIIVPKEGNLEKNVKFDSKIENDSYSIYVIDNILNLYDKKNNVVYENFISFVNEIDRGDTYVFEPTSDEKQISKLVSYNFISYGDFYQEANLEFELNSYVEYNFEELKPVLEINSTIIQVKLILTSNNIIEVKYKFVNESKDHRVRIHIETGISNKGIITDVPFDISMNFKSDASIVSKSKTFFNSTFAAKKGENVVAIYTEGQHEVEELDTKLAFTILRSTGYIARIEGHLPSAGELFNAPGNQLLGEISGRLGIEILNNKVNSAKMFQRARFFRNGFIHYFNSAEANKFLGGRFAVQDTSIAELFYLKDRYENQVVPFKSPFKLSSSNIVVSSYRINKNNETILRLINFSNDITICEIITDLQIFETTMLEEEFSEINKEITFKPKEIKTLKLV